jgi:hypothetical protein
MAQERDRGTTGVCCGVHAPRGRLPGALQLLPLRLLPPHLPPTRHPPLPPLVRPPRPVSQLLHQKAQG